MTTVVVVVVARLLPGSKSPNNIVPITDFLAKLIIEPSHQHDLRPKRSRLVPATPYRRASSSPYLNRDRYLLIDTFQDE